MKPILLKSIFSAGLNIGLISVILSVLLYILNIMPVGILKPIILFLLSFAITFFLVLFFSKRIRSEIYDGKMSFGQGFIVGLLMVACAAFISSIYSVVFNLFIEPDYFMNVIEAQKEWMYNFMISRGVPEDTIIESIDKIDANAKAYRPVREFLLSFVVGTILGAIISLITAAILREKPVPFE